MKGNYQLNIKALSFFRNMSYTISANLISLIVSTLVILIIPKLIGVEEYGYWQLYLFYSSYVGFFHFGLNDGIYLRFGGEEYKNLDKKLFFSQFLELLFSQFIFGLLIWGLTVLLDLEADRGFIWNMVAVSMIIVNTRLILLYILQATNRIKEYAHITMLDRIIYILLVIFFIAFGIKDYKIMIFADLLGKFVSLFVAMLVCRDIVFNKISSFYFTIKEMIHNINVGMKLMFANIASALIIGIIRFGIERTWDVSTFGKVSLTFSISSMMMIFINAVGIILFPILRRTSKDRLSNIYKTIRDFLMLLLLGVLVFYYPLKTSMTIWLPQYSDSLLYMALLFPMFIYEGKTALLINTYFKTLRLENIMLRINLITMLISILLTYFTTQVFVNLNITVFSILVLLIIRSVLSEFYLSKKLGIKVTKDIVSEIVMTIIFVLLGWYVDSWMTLIVYSMSYVIYILMKKSDVIETIQNIKMQMKV